MQNIPASEAGTSPEHASVHLALMLHQIIPLPNVKDGSTPLPDTGLFSWKIKIQQLGWRLKYQAGPSQSSLLFAALIQNNMLYRY